VTGTGNPYEAPAAPVEDLSEAIGAGSLREVARKVSAGRAIEWYREGWRLFTVSPLAWIGIWLLYIVITIAISIVPLLGGFVNAILGMVLIGGIMIAADGAARERVVRVDRMFAGFSTRFGPLVLLGLLQLVIWIVVTVILFFVVSIGIGVVISSAGVTGEPDFSSPRIWGPMVGVGLLLGFLLVPIMYATWLGAALIALHHSATLDALRMGFVAVGRNLGAFFLTLIVGLGLAIVAAIPIFLGFFVMGPVFLCTIYCQYRDLFIIQE
jgi:hypothetical protein